MGSQALCLSQGDDIICSGIERRRGVGDNAGLLHEGFHIQNGVEFSSTTGGQHMVGTGIVIAQGLGGILA